MSSLAHVRGGLSVRQLSDGEAYREIFLTPAATGTSQFSECNNTSIAALDTMNTARSIGANGSKGTYAPPALKILSIPMTIQGDRSAINPTGVFGPTP